MKIAFFASSLVSAYWNGAATYYRGIIRALFGLGYDVTFYEPDAYDRQRHRDIDDPPWATVVVYPAHDDAGEDGVRRALERARRADIIVKTSGVGVFDALLEEAVLDVKALDLRLKGLAQQHGRVDGDAASRRRAAKPQHHTPTAFLGRGNVRNHDASARVTGLSRRSRSARSTSAAVAVSRFSSSAQ